MSSPNDDVGKRVDVQCATCVGGVNTKFGVRLYTILLVPCKHNAFSCAIVPESKVPHNQSRYISSV